MKTRKLIELERKGLEIMEEARQLLAALDPTLPAEEFRKIEQQHVAKMAEYDVHALDIREQQLCAEERSVDTSRRPGGSTTAAAVDEDASDFARAWSGDARTGWADKKGNPVPVLRPADQWASDPIEGVSLGDAVRAKITGPRNDLERRALSEGTDSAGGYTVPAPLATWFIDRLRRKSVAIRAGAMTVPMDSDTLAIARLETDPTIGWRAENASIAEGDPTFGRVLLNAKSLSGIVKFSRELFMDTANAGAMIEQAMTKVMALEIDRAAIYGDGSNDSPTGITNTSGINTVSMGTNGGQLSSYDKLIDAWYELALDNVEDVSAMILAPRTTATLAKLKDGQANPLQVPDLVRAIPRLTTTAASIAETQGTANNASSVVMGNFAELLIGMREEINVRVLSEIFAGNGQIALLVHARADVQLVHKESFCQLKGIIP